MTEYSVELNAITLLISAIEDIQHNWENGDLADAVRNAIATKDEICQQFHLPSTADIEAHNASEEAQS
jgi:hypothetical protein